MVEYGLQYSRDVRQIDLDVNRTYRNHIMFRERYNTKQQMLFRVLVAYSVYNSVFLFNSSQYIFNKYFILRKLDIAKECLRLPLFYSCIWMKR